MIRRVTRLVEASFPWRTIAVLMIRGDAGASTDCPVRSLPLAGGSRRVIRRLAVMPGGVTSSASRPAGGERFVKRLEKLLGRVLRRGKPGRKRKAVEK